MGTARSSRATSVRTNLCRERFFGSPDVGNDRRMSRLRSSVRRAIMAVIARLSAARIAA